MAGARFDEPVSLLQLLTTEPPRPDAIRRQPRAYWLVVATVCVGAFMGQLDASIVSLALPTLQRDFHATLGLVEWVSLSYLLLLVGTVVAVGRFADMVGRKLLYTYGFLVFTVASAACAFAPSLPALIGFRAVQAIGAAMLQANSVALITLAMPRGKLARGIGVQGAAQALGLALGPTVGGLLVAAGGWRLVFLVNVPAGVVGTVLGWLLLPRSRNLPGRSPFDWIGLALFVPAVCALLLALSFGAFAVGLPIAAVFAAAFVWREMTAPNPLMPLGFFRRAAFSGGLLSGLISYLVLFGVLFVTPFYLEHAHGMPADRAGLELAILPFAIGVMAPVAGRMSERWGTVLPTVGGMVTVAAGLGVAALAHAMTPWLLVGLLLAGLGIGAFTPANNASIMAAAPPGHAGVAGGVLNMTRGIGTALGVAVAGALYEGAATPARGHVAAVLALAAFAGLAALVAAATGRSHRAA